MRILHESDDLPSLRSSFASSKFSKALGRNSFKISFDWREHPQLADLDTYVIPLLSSLNNRNNEISDNPHIPNIEKDSFIEFLRKLYIEGSCKGKLGSSLSVDNIQELKKAVAVILNHLDSLRGEENFQKFYADVVHDVCDALEHCSNRINPQIDRIILDLKAKGGSLGEKIALFLQKQRSALLTQVIHEAVASSQPRYVSMWGMVKNAHFFLEHEAASTNFYFRELSDQLGIVSHLSKTDFAHPDHVCKGLKDEILSCFCRVYNGEKILDWVAEAILSPYDSSIPTRLFTDWVSSHNLADEDICLDPSTGHYKKELIAFMLRELEVLS